MLTFIAANFPLVAQAYDQNDGSNGWSRDGSGYDGGGSYSNSCGTYDDGRGSRTLGVIGLTSDQRLICFNEYSPGSASNIGTIQGLTGDSRIVGIDYRVQDGKLYGLGNLGGIYTLDTRNARATKVNQLTIAMTGNFFGVDFNPAADALRIISETGQNLRHSFVNNTTTMDGTLTYTAPPAAPTPATGVTGAGYTNNDLDMNTATTLYDVDSMMDQVAIQSPANSGILVATGKLTVDTTPDVGFDIYSTIRNGVTVSVRALASLTSSNGTVRLYSVTLATGKAVSRGTFSSRNKVIGIAIPLNQL